LIKTKHVVFQMQSVAYNIKLHTAMSKPSKTFHDYLRKTAQIDSTQDWFFLSFIVAASCSFTQFSQ